MREHARHDRDRVARPPQPGVHARAGGGDGPRALGLRAEARRGRLDAGPELPRDGARRRPLRAQDRQHRVAALRARAARTRPCTTLRPRPPASRPPSPCPPATGARSSPSTGHDVRLVTWIDGSRSATRATAPPGPGTGSARSPRGARAGSPASSIPSWTGPCSGTRGAPARSSTPSPTPRRRRTRRWWSRRWRRSPPCSRRATRPAAQPIHCDVTDYNIVGRGRAAAPVPDGADRLRRRRAHVAIGDPARPRPPPVAHDPDQALRDRARRARRLPRRAAADGGRGRRRSGRSCSRAPPSARSSGTHQARLSPENAHIAKTTDDDWAIVRGAAAVHPAVATAASRAACGLAPWPAGEGLAARLSAAGAVPVVGGRRPAGAARLRLARPRSTHRTPAGAGSGGSAAARRGRRPLGRGAARGRPARLRAPATLHLGADVHVPAGSAVRAPLAGRVESAGDGAVVLRARGRAGVRAARRARSGRRARRARRRRRRWSCRATAAAAPHAHVQLAAAARPAGPGHAARAGRLAGALPRPVAAPRRRRAPRRRARRRARGARAPRARRRRAAAPLLRRPAASSCAAGAQCLYDADGRAVPRRRQQRRRLGHSHPAVAEAAARQFRLLNTNSRFLYGVMSELRRAARRPAARALDRVFLVNTGSEAIDLALRLARVATGRQDVRRARGRLPRLDHGDRRALRQRRSTARTGASCCRRTSTSPSSPTPTAAASATTARRTSPSLRGELAARGRARRRGGVRLRAAARQPGRRADRRAATSPPPTRPPARRAAVCVADEVQVGYAPHGRRLLGLRATRACCPTSSASPRPRATATRSAP